jgi:FMN-dependent NADH-azoreductase
LVNSCTKFLWNKKIDIIAADQMALDYEKSIKEAEEQIEKVKI